MKDWKNYKQELLKDPETYQEYLQLETEYRLAQQLLKARLQKKLSQAELANMAGVKQEYIARLESGNANPTIGSLSKIASVLGKRLKLVGS